MIMWQDKKVNISVYALQALMEKGLSIVAAKFTRPR